MNLFDKLYNITEDAAKLLKKPFVLNKVKRALATAQDNLQSQLLELDASISKLRGEIVNGDTKKISRLYEEISTREDLIKLAAIAEKEPGIIFGSAP